MQNTNNIPPFVVDMIRDIREAPNGASRNHYIARMEDIVYYINTHMKEIETKAETNLSEYQDSGTKSLVELRNELDRKIQEMDKKTLVEKQKVDYIKNLKLNLNETIKIAKSKSF